jgi:hypothetical protein
MIPSLHSRICLSFSVFPELLRLVGPGREYDGYTVTIQGGQCWPAWRISLYKICDQVLCKQRLALVATGTTNAAYERARLVSVSRHAEAAL